MADLIGRTLGQYHIIEKIGEGGMAAVYKAYQPGLKRYVAVKVLPPPHAKQPGFSQRFEREAEAIANLHHPNILPVYDSGQEEDYSFIVMRYVEGARTLKEVMQTPLSLGQVADLVRQIAAALDYARQQGVVHRDVKPSNVLMDGDWALLTDFGLAKMTETTIKLTRTGAGIGTPAYMSPEQGQGLPVDHRTDIYSLGVILFEMLTGQIPHDAQTPVAIIFKRATEPVPLPSALDPNIPEAVEGVILKALARQPNVRFGSAGALAAALEDAVREAGTETSEAPLLAAEERTTAPVPENPPSTEGARPPSTASGPARPPPPWRWLAGIAVLVIAAMGLSIVLVSRSTPNPTPTIRLVSKAERPIPPTPRLTWPPTGIPTSRNGGTTQSTTAGALVSSATAQAEIGAPTKSSNEPIPTVSPAAASSAASKPSPTPTMPATATPESGKGQISIRLTHKNGQPAVGYGVFYGSECGTVAGLTKICRESRAQTDSKGHYTFENVPSGEWWTAYQDIFSPFATEDYYPGKLRKITMAAGDTQVVDFSIPDVAIKLVSPPNNAALQTKRPSFQWEAYPEVIEYHLLLEHQSDTDDNRYFRVAAPVFSLNCRYRDCDYALTAHTEITPSMNLKPGHYRWVVEGWGPSEDSSELEVIAHSEVGASTDFEDNYYTFDIPGEQKLVTWLFTKDFVGGIKPSRIGVENYTQKELILTVEGMDTLEIQATYWLEDVAPGTYSYTAEVSGLPSVSGTITIESGFYDWVFYVNAPQ